MNAYFTIGFIAAIVVFILWIFIPLFIKFNHYALDDYYRFINGKTNVFSELFEELGAHFLIAIIVGIFSIVLYPFYIVIIPMVLTIHLIRRRNIKKKQ